MKPLPVITEANEGQRRFWRSLDELADAPAVRQLIEREFPSQLSVWDDPVGRRRFLQLMGASLAFAGVAGCSTRAPEKIVPYVRSPEEIVPGKPLYFATAYARGGYSLGLLVESHEGRPTKIEGNPEHPASLGATDAFAQASILSLYDPDRSQTVRYRGGIETWDRFLTGMRAEMERLKENRGAGLRILTETITSPTLAGQLAELLEQYPDAHWHQYEPAHLDNVREGARLALGRYADVLYRFDQADVIVSLDADFLTALPGSVRYARDFLDKRRVAEQSAMSRLYVAESTPTITGAMADHRLPLGPQHVERLAGDIAERLGVSLPATSGRNATEVVSDSAWLEALISDLEAHRGAGVVLAGIGQPPIVHTICHAINQHLENVGQTVQFIEPVEARPENQLASLTQLVEDMRAGQVETLVMLGGNPVYNAPGTLKFAEALAKARLRVHLSLYDDETSFLCDWHIPAAHYLESWGDARAYDGTASIVQPLIAPLYEGRTAHEVLAALAGQAGRTTYEIVQEHWQRNGPLTGDDFGAGWRRAVHDGVIPETQSQPIEAQVNLTASDEELAEIGNGLVVEFRPDPSLGDGSEANNGWLQELPKPLTKITWDNVALVSAATAQRLKVTSGDVVEIAVGEDTARAPIWIMPGQSDECVSLTFGYGRTRAGRIGTGVGYNAYAIRPLREAWFAAAELTKTGGRHEIATTQSHHSMDGHDIVRVTTLERYRENPNHLAAAGHSAESLPSLYPEFPYEGNAWGMVIDQSACIGCNACVVACQAENNIPIVGKEQVAVGREMHWLRIDRYWSGPKENELENPETYFQPMMCVHCEKAPCEVVCPVAATVHDSEGTSNMVYNRCVGTRYCSNNCPYKVRRFNYLQFSDETTPSLKLLRNPDVTVRSRGVMEKCSYCIQRISHARIEAKKENRPIRDGEVVTACQQVCPTRAITFGNINDPQAAVTRLKQSPLNYGVLAELGTQPRTTHLARVVNPHPGLSPPSAAERPSAPEGSSSPKPSHS